MTPTEKLYLLFDENKKNPSEKYVHELLTQIHLLGTECNSLTRSYIRTRLQEIVNNIDHTTIEY
jgi:hypothetical protein